LFFDIGDRGEQRAVFPFGARRKGSVGTGVSCKLGAQRRVGDGCAVGKHSARLVRLGSDKLSMTTGEMWPIPARGRYM
jgi:hypothetical protein